MNDLISRAAAIDYLMTNMGWRDEDGYEVDDADEKCAIITDLVNGIPAVDAVPVVHGRWSKKRWITEYDWGVINHRAIVCSACKGEIADGEQTHYCPNCGARMDGERRDDDGSTD